MVKKQFVSWLFVFSLMGVILISATGICFGERRIVDENNVQLLNYSQYHALVIGISNYYFFQKLRKPVKDAREIAFRLKRAGYSVSLQLNPTGEQMKKSFDQLTATIGKNKEAGILIYYVGHSQTKALNGDKKTGYLIPVDCPLLEEDEVEFKNKAVSLKIIGNKIKGMVAKHVLIIIDGHVPLFPFYQISPQPEPITAKVAVPVRQMIVAGVIDSNNMEKSILKQGFLSGFQGEADINKDSLVSGMEMGIYLSEYFKKDLNKTQSFLFGVSSASDQEYGDIILNLGEGSKVIKTAALKKDIPNKAPVAKKIQKSKLFIITEPQDAVVRILNIKPKYKKGIELSPGKYLVDVQKAGYTSHRKWITIKDEKLTEVAIILQKKKKMVEKTVQKKDQTEVKPEGYSSASMSTDVITILKDYKEIQLSNPGEKILNLFWKKIKKQLPGANLPEERLAYEALFFKIIDTPTEATVMDRIVQEKLFPDEYTNTYGMKFIYISPGTFMMGSPEKEKGRDDDEVPHRVHITKGFYMQTTELTQEQWMGIMGYNPSENKQCGKKCPVEAVSYRDVLRFIEKLNKKENSNAFRLPTEAEWEYACRAGSQTRFCYGDEDELIATYAWFSKNSNNSLQGVGLKKPNNFGLYDMHGNVWEWCSDWYGPYPNQEVTDPHGVTSGSSRVRRGGSFSGSGGFWLIKNSDQIRSANRDHFSPSSISPVLGFRLVRDL